MASGAYIGGVVTAGLVGVGSIIAGAAQGTPSLTIMGATVLVVT